MLRPYQQDILTRTEQSLDDGHNPIVCAPCGAGKSYIMKELSQGYSNVLIVAHRRELLRQHEELFDGMQNVRFASIFTEARHIGEYPTPDIILCDEAHLSQAQSYLKVFDWYAVPIVGFTATPTRLDGEPLSAYDDIIQCLSADDLIAAGHLAPYKYYAPTLYDVSQIKPKYGDYSAEDLESIVCRSALYGDVISTYRKLADGRQAIAYCSTTAHSRATAQAFCDAGIPAVHIDGTSSDTVRQEALDGFRAGKYRILCNVNLISEGISIPECSVVLGLRPTMSRALYIQQMCRALRWAPGKEAILIDFCGNVHRHGMPTTHYLYEIGKRAEKHSEFTAAGDFTVRICQDCFRTMASSATVCPYCGAPYQTHPREIAMHQEIELAEIKAAEAAAEQKRMQQLKEDIKAARSLRDFQIIARKNGYKPGWAYQRAKARGYIK